MRARVVYWVGAGQTNSWREAANWSLTPGGRPGYPPPQHGVVAILDASGGVGTANLTGCPATVTISGYRGVVTLPSGGTLDLRETARPWHARLRPRAWRVRPRVLSALRRPQSGSWLRALREGRALLGEKLGSPAVVYPAVSGAVDRYWVGGTGPWNNSSTANWAGSSGGASGASAPTSSDNVFFDANSGLTADTTVTIAATAACNNWTVAGIAAIAVTFALSGNFSPSGTVSIDGNTRQRQLLIASNTIGTPRTLTIATLASLTNCDFRDIAGAGAASPFTGTAVGNGLGNSGITFTPAVTRYAVVAGNWSDTATWSTTSGGAGGASVPLPQDAVFLNASSAAGSYAADIPRLCANLDFTGFTRTFSLTRTISVHGNLTLASGMTISGGVTWNLRGRSSHTVTSNGKAFPSSTSMVALAFGGTYTLADALSLPANGTLTLTNGTLNDGGFAVAPGAFSSNNTNTRALVMTGTWSLARTGTVTIWNVTSTLTLTATGSTIAITATDSGVTKTFAGGGLTYGTVSHTAAGSAGLTITGNNVYSNLTLTDTTARTVTFPAGGNQKVTGTFTYQGASGQNLSLVSSSPGTGTTIYCCTTVTNGFVSVSADVTISEVANTVAPAVTGTTVVGQTLSTTDGTWTGSPVITYQWQRDNQGGGVWSNIGGATTNTHLLVNADDACNIRCVITGTSPAGCAEVANSNTVGPVTEPVPVNSVAPVVSGTPEVGQTLSCSTGTWTNMGGFGPTFTYQWQRDNHGGGTFGDIGGATANTHLLTASDDGCQVRCRVTAHNTGGSTTAASNDVDVVQPVPVNTSAPVASGSPYTGNTVSVTNGSWNNMGGYNPSFTYQWQISPDGVGSWVDITGETTSSYLVDVADLGSYLRAVVTAHNTGGTTPASSNVLGPVVPPPPEIVIPPTVTGRLRPGEFLDCTTGVWDGDPTSYAYQWQRSSDGVTWSDVGDDVNTYLIARADTGYYLRCVVTATSAGGSSSASSNVVGPILLRSRRTILGCGKYDVHVFERGGETYVGTLPWESLDFGRLLDDTSTASCSGTVADGGDCCSWLGDVWQWEHEIGIERDGEIVWVGPIVGLSAPSGSFSLQARDLSAWWDHRLIHKSHTFEGADLASMFTAFAEDAMEPDPSPNFNVSATPCRVKGTRSILALQHQYAGPALRELSDIGIDWTVIGRDAFVGGLVVPTDELPTLSDASFAVPPTPNRDGLKQGNRVVARGAGGGAAGDSVYAISADRDVQKRDGLLEAVESQSTIGDYTSAKQLADSRLALLKERVTTIQNCRLDPSAPIPFDQLVPGALVPVSLSQTCLPVHQTFRLGGVNVHVAPGSDDSVELLLQPLGTE